MRYHKSITSTVKVSNMYVKQVHEVPSRFVKGADRVSRDDGPARRTNYKVHLMFGQGARIVPPSMARTPRRYPKVHDYILKDPVLQTQYF